MTPNRWTPTLRRGATRAAGWVAGLAALTCLMSGGALAAPTYQVQDLGSLGRQAPSYVEALSARGDMAGWVRQGRRQTSRPVRFDHHQPVDLISETGVDAREGTARAINRRGQIAGGLIMNDGRALPFVYQQGTMEVVEMPTGLPGWGVGLSDQGHLLALGESNDGGHCSQCSFVRQPDGSWTALQRWRGGDMAVGTAINRHGLVVGWADGAHRQGPRRAVVWRSDTPHLVPGTANSPSATALAVNDDGDIAGRFAVGAHWHAFVVRAGALTDLETDPTADSEAFGLDERGRVVGRRSAGGRSGGFLAEDGQLLWLDDLIAPAQQGQWQVLYAVDINQAGEIAAEGRAADGQVHALRLVPLSAR